MSLLLLQVGLIGFLVVIGLSRLSAKKDVEKNVQFAESGKISETPVKSPAKPLTPIEKKSGSVMTPGGRRSARLAKRRKED